MDEKEVIREHMREIGRKGGEKTKQKGTDYRMLGKIGASKRWSKEKKEESDESNQ